MTLEESCLDDLFLYLGETLPDIGYSKDQSSATIEALRNPSGPFVALDIISRANRARNVAKQNKSRQQDHICQLKEQLKQELLKKDKVKIKQLEQELDKAFVDIEELSNKLDEVFAKASEVSNIAAKSIDVYYGRKNSERT